MAENWHIRGELTLSCNCTVFCPCVLSLGQHPPTEGYCQTWLAVRIDDGHFGDVELTGAKVALLAEIPGLLARGNWTAGLFIDERASIYAVKALTRIFTGKAGGNTGLLDILVGSFLGVRQVPISYAVEYEKRIVQIPGIIDGVIAPVSGNKRNENVTVSNSEYWIAPDITVCRAEKSRLRVFGRNWNFAGRSAELCQIDWSGP